MPSGRPSLVTDALTSLTPEAVNLLGIVDLWTAQAGAGGSGHHAPGEERRAEDRGGGGGKLDTRDGMCSSPRSLLLGGVLSGRGTFRSTAPPRNPPIPSSLIPRDAVHHHTVVYGIVA